MADEVVQVRRIGREQHERAEARGTDRIALGDGFGRVAHRVERVGRLAHVAFEARHFRDAAGIVRHRTERIERHDHAGERQHRRNRNRDSEQAREAVGEHDADADDQRRQAPSTSIEIARPWMTLVPWPVTRRGRDHAHRAVIGARIIFRDPDDRAGHCEADDAAEERATCPYSVAPDEVVSSALMSPPRIQLISGHKPASDSTPVTITPL